MNLTRPNLISKQGKSIPAEAKDISYSGIGCYTNKVLYCGMKMNITIDNNVHTGQVMHVAKIDSLASKYHVGMAFCGRKDSKQNIKQYVDKLSLNTYRKPSADTVNEKRRDTRKFFDQPIQISLSETSANIITENNFHISKNGFTCYVDQYVPLFREIEIKINSHQLKAQESSLEGIVVKCDKIEDYYDLAVFCPLCNLEELTDLSIN
ncbi:hypothetical protein J7L67_06230 [bacterium]|nr:hypothetical protein [bacterium]